VGIKQSQNGNGGDQMASIGGNISKTNIFNFLGTGKDGEDENNIELPETAIEILIEMASEQGDVLRIRRETLGGAYEAHTGCKEFTAGHNDKKRKMEIVGAIEELEKRKLIEPKKADKTVYEITPKGFKFAETVTQKTAVTGTTLLDINK
jgi:hypothetical protein